MSTVRFTALAETLKREPLDIKGPERRLSEHFGEKVFNLKAMREHLPEEAFEQLNNAISTGAKIDRKIAEQVASAMRSWAAERGVTHYTHWFQPLTGSTAEKHDAFFSPSMDGTAIDRFDGALLVQQEPDASSFPNGGIRNTFEARGYTAWDPTSPAFIIGSTLCIPSVFVSYTGEALDTKVPLLRALSAVDAAATKVCQYFDKKVSKVTATLGWEQEYFLIDSALFNARPDLVQTGRTLFGHAPARGQQLDDHYFGSIPERAMSFMRDLELESVKLGIPVKTRHNEVAPNQFEAAPVYEEANLAVDHNSLFVDLIEKLARKHNFRALIHEKPFKGVNGSGKHNNWSLATDTGVNLLSPGKTPKSNLQFLTFFINSIKAVHDNAKLLRATIATAGNEHRLGANEAPPAIISVFIGSQLTSVLDELEKVSHGKLSPEQKTDLKLNVVGKIPEILLDNTDRNRTSPFAFTGNKFEFRAVGSAANCAVPMTVLNTIMADQLNQFSEDVEASIEKGMSKDEAIFNVLRDYIKACKAIRFEGDGYSDDWVTEALKRGLPNITNTPEAIKEFASKSALDLFKRTGVMNDVEVEARQEINLEEYLLKIQIESRVMGDLALNHVLPTAFKYMNRLVGNVEGLKKVYSEKEFKEIASVQLGIIKQLSKHIEAVSDNVHNMVETRKKVNVIENAEEKALAYFNEVKPFFDEIRYHVDKLELSIDDELWPLPKYRELLFTK